MWKRSLVTMRTSALLCTNKRAFASATVMNAEKVALNQVPLVDIGPLVHHAEQPVSATQRQEILQQIKVACLETGFFTIPTKGVLSNDLLKKVYQRKDEFLALPDDVKRKYHNKNTPNARGWTPMFEEPSYQPDQVSSLEGFDLARELSTEYIAEGSSLGPNIWPTEVPHFQEDVYRLYDETTKVSNVLFQSFAEMLDLPPNTFLQHVSEKAEAFMRLLTYPKSEAKVKNSTVGISSHTDFECFTIIHQNGQGLHLLNRQGVWVEAPVCEDRLFVMVGDILERWTNGVLVATEHRVVNSDEKRQSIVRFNGTDGDTVVEPLPQFVWAENPSKYTKTTQREHIAEQIRLAEEYLKEAKAAKQASA